MQESSLNTQHKSPSIGVQNAYHITYRFGFYRQLLTFDMQCSRNKLQGRDSRRQTIGTLTNEGHQRPSRCADVFKIMLHGKQRTYS